MSSRHCELRAFSWLPQDIPKFAKAGVTTLQGVDRSANNVAKAQEAVKGFKNTRIRTAFDAYDVFTQSMRDLLPPSSFDAVACFNGMHKLMESHEVCNRFFSNAAYLLKVPCLSLSLSF